MGLQALPALDIVSPRPEDLGVDAQACEMLRAISPLQQQGILDLLSQGLLAGNVSNPSGFVVKEVIAVTPMIDRQVESDVTSTTPLLTHAASLSSGSPTPLGFP